VTNLALISVVNGAVSLLIECSVTCSNSMELKNLMFDLVGPEL